MRKYILLIILVLNFIALASLEAKNPDRVERKTFTGISSVNIDQKYGNIVVNETRTKDVTLEIQYFDTPKAKAQCVVSHSKGSLLIETILSQKNSNQNAPRIDYILTVPQSTAFEITQKYGDFRANSIGGTFVASLMYGDFSVNTFTTPSPNITVRYGKVKIDQAKDINLLLAYSDARIEKANILVFSGNYNDLTINILKTLDLSSSSAYNTYNIKSLNELKKASLKYDKLKVGDLTSSLNVSTAYSDIVVGVSNNTAKIINVKGAYSDVIINLAPQISALINSTLTYGDLKVDSKYTVNQMKKTRNAMTNVDEVKIGTASSPQLQITVSGAYSDVKIK